MFSWMFMLLMCAQLKVNVDYGLIVVLVKRFVL